MQVNKYALFFMAGTLWTMAGTMVLSFGLRAIQSGLAWAELPAALAVFFAFYHFIFSALVKKHERRINTDSRSRLPWWMFFDRQGYLIMAAMMSGGLLLRLSGILPPFFLAFFYSGLGAALLSCGLRFISVGFRQRRITALS